MTGSPVGLTLDSIDLHFDSNETRLTLTFGYQTQNYILSVNDDPHIVANVVADLRRDLGQKVAIYEFANNVATLIFENGSIQKFGERDNIVF